jgi:hypothetical protein
MAPRPSRLAPRPRAITSMSDDMLRQEVRRAISERLVSGEIPTLLAEIYRRDIWREESVPGRGIVRYANFHAYLTEGLSVDPAVVLRMARIVPRTELVLIRALRGEHGGKRRNEAAREIKSNNVRLDRLDQGNSRGWAIRKLADKRPDLQARVAAGDLSPHAAMLEAGLRHPTATIRTDDLVRALRVLLKHFPLAKVRAALEAWERISDK